MDKIERYKPIVPRIQSYDRAPGRPTPQATEPQTNRGRKILKRGLWALLVVVIILGGFLAIRTYQITGKIFVGERASFTKRIADFFSFGGSKLIGEDLGQVNVLLLGIGGQGHDGGYLADTIILAQIRPDINKISLSAIPRDYLANLPGLGQRKINAAFAETWQKTKNWDEAGRAIREAAGNVSGLDIPYFAVIDFKGFELGIDKLGGIDVDIPRTFTDYTFPDSNNGYLPAVTFKQGMEHMTGERALIYARSRHAGNGEGSDFARSQRQQLIMHAVKQKAISLNLVTNAGTINSLLSILGDHFHTNINPGELYRLYNITQSYPRENIISNNLNPETKLICPKILEESGAYVLVPCPGKTAADVEQFFVDGFEKNGQQDYGGTVWLADSSNGGTLYKEAERRLNEAGFTVYRVSYKTQPLDRSVVYQADREAKGLEYITKTLDGAAASVPPPGINIDPAKVDFVVILGGTLPKENN